MPSYVCTTVADRLDESQRAAVAAAVTRAHHQATGAPAYFVRVEFVEVAPGAVFIGGAPLAHDHLFVRGAIRGGRDAATRAALIAAITDGVHAAVPDLDRRALWVYLAVLDPEDMVEFGHTLPATGQEAAWQAALPDADRQWLQSLGP
jgi:phenylpyruvate tautomerase PptA (4-oxalocrotonate tautomerase family)